jgi:formamidopyrimidine-DNA glycosylase
LSRQMNASLAGKTVRKGTLGNSPHKFVWYNRTQEEFQQLTAGKTAGQAYTCGRWLFLPLEPGYVLVLGECGGKTLFHPAGEALPPKYHLYLGFEDGCFLTATTQMWGAMELYARGEECQRQYIRDMRPYPTQPEFSPAYFSALVEELSHLEKRSAKALLTQDQLIPGLGNSIAQDILFKAHLHPRHPIDRMDARQVRALYDAILATVAEIVEQGGRSDEVDLFGRPGGYNRRMDKHAAGKPCPACGATVQSIQYLGGSCYFCPTCQE